MITFVGLDDNNFDILAIKNNRAWDLNRIVMDFKITKSFAINNAEIILDNKVFVYTCAEELKVSPLLVGVLLAITKVKSVNEIGTLITKFRENAELGYSNALELATHFPDLSSKKEVSSPKI